MMEKEKLKYPYFNAEMKITQILCSDVIQTSGGAGSDSETKSWDGSNTSSNGWT